MQSFTGIVQKGNKRGTRLGFPTANISLKDSTLSGIFAGRVILENEAPYMAAIYADSSRGVLEAHLLDFADDLYGLPVTIELHKRLRAGARFKSESDLREAIAKDVADVRKFFSG